MFKFIREHRSEIKISLGTGVILLFVQAFGKDIFDGLIVFLTRTSSTFSEHLYKTIARNDSTWFDESTSYFLTVAVSLVIIVTGIVLLMLQELETKS